MVKQIWELNETHTVQIRASTSREGMYLGRVVKEGDLAEGIGKMGGQSPR